MKRALRYFLPALAVLPAPCARAQANNTATGIGPGVTSASLSGNGIGDSARSATISGKVVMDDGSPVPPNITIQRLCSGSVHSVAYTDAKGHFSFSWGKTASLVLTDASEAGSGSKHSTNTGFGGSQSAGGSNPLSSDPFGNRMLYCQLRADLAGYRSDAVSISDDAGLASPDIGSIVLHRLAGVEGYSVSTTSLEAPKAATRAYERGEQSLLKDKPEDAAKDFEKAVAIYPKYADAWAKLGKVRLQQKSYAPARDAYLKAIAADPKLVEPYMELGMLSAQDGKWEDSAGYFDHAVGLDPVDFPQAWYADAVAHYNLKRYDAAEASARQAIRLDPKHVNARANYLLGMALIEKKDYAAAAEELKTFMALSPNAPDLDAAKVQLAQIEDVLRDAAK